MEGQVDIETVKDEDRLGDIVFECVLEVLGEAECEGLGEETKDALPMLGEGGGDIVAV